MAAPGRLGNLLAALGPQAAPEVISRLPAEELVEALVHASGVVPDPGLEYLDPGLEVCAWLATQRALGKEGPRHARKVAKEIRGHYSGDDTLEEIDRVWEERIAGRADPACPEQGARVSSQLAAALSDAGAPGAALALVLAPRAVARRTLVELTAQGREDIPLWIAGLDSAYPHFFSDPERGEEILSELLDGMRTEVRQRVLAVIRAQDEELWGRLYDRGFGIRELEALEDADLAELLNRASADDVALALREAPERLRRRCMRQLPRGLRTQVAVALEQAEPVRLRDLERARNRVGAICRDLGFRGGVHAAG